MCRVGLDNVRVPSEFHFLLVNQIEEMIPNVNTSFITFNIRYDFKTSLVPRTENNAISINLISTQLNSKQSFYYC